MLREPVLSAVALVVLLAVACGPAQVPGGTTASGVDLPAEIDGANIGEALRQYHRMAFDSPARVELRDLIVAHFDRETPALVEADDYEAVVEHFAAMTDLLTPEDIGAGRVPRALAAPAAYLIERGSPPGDEARVLAAHLVLSRIEPDDAAHQGRYEQLSRWGRDARSTVENPLDRYTQLIEIWSEHARLTPTPDVLSTLAGLHVERRDAIFNAFREGPMLRGLRALPSQVERIAPLDVAAVYLAQGDIASAVTHVEAMGGGSETVLRLVRLLEEARREGGEGSDAAIELAEAFREARPAVAVGMCRHGLRRFPNDARFAGCLARVAADLRHPAEATGWYAISIELAPEVQPLYDEALEQLNEFIEEGIFDADADEARALARHAEQILDERRRRWPDSTPPVSPAQLHYLMGMLEMNAGNATEAMTRLRSAIEERETPSALLQLGLLLERTGSPAEAATHYRRALDLTPENERSDALRRAEILERLGDAFRESDNAMQATRMYREALSLWSGAQTELEGAGPALALLQVRRGVLLDRLGHGEESSAAFRAAMGAVPNTQETFATILAYLVVSDPKPELAVDVFRQANRQLTLAPEWKVYFSLWIKAIHGRAGRTLDPEITSLLASLAQSDSWWGSLARFGTGDLPYADLLGDASRAGQETEAHFYEGARRLTSGDAEGARLYFQRVVGTNMVSFYEFAMAQELLRGSGAPAEGGPEASRATPTAAE